MHAYKSPDTPFSKGLALSSSLSRLENQVTPTTLPAFLESSVSPVQTIIMKPCTLFVALVPVALAAPVANAEANAVAEDKRDDYATYGTYTNPAPPPEGYGTYGSYPAPAPPPTSYGTYATYPPPAGGYSSYGSYKRSLEGLVKKIFG